MSNYFEGCTTEIECKKRYRELAKKYHPDTGGDAATMVEVNLQFKRLKEAGYTVSEKTRPYTWEDLFGKSQSYTQHGDAVRYNFDYEAFYSSIKKAKQQQRQKENAWDKRVDEIMGLLMKGDPDVTSAIRKMIKSVFKNGGTI